MCLFGCRNRRRSSCCNGQWGTTENTVRSNTRGCTACGETVERRTWDRCGDNCRTVEDSFDCDD